HACYRPKCIWKGMTENYSTPGHPLQHRHFDVGLAHYLKNGSPGHSDHMREHRARQSERWEGERTKQMIEIRKSRLEGDRGKQPPVDGEQQNENRTNEELRNRNQEQGER